MLQAYHVARLYLSFTIAARSVHGCFQFYGCPDSQVGDPDTGGLVIAFNFEQVFMTGVQEVNRLAQDGICTHADRLSRYIYPYFKISYVTLTDCFGIAFELQMRSEEHTSALQSLMRISYAVFCITH